jgi:hypothetical protein
VVAAVVELVPEALIDTTVAALLTTSPFAAGSVLLAGFAPT